MAYCLSFQHMKLPMTARLDNSRIYSATKRKSGYTSTTASYFYPTTVFITESADSYLRGKFILVLTKNTNALAQ